MHGISSGIRMIFILLLYSVHIMMELNQFIAHLQTPAGYMQSIFTTKMRNLSNIVGMITIQTESSPKKEHPSQRKLRLEQRIRPFPAVPVFLSHKNQISCSTAYYEAVQQNLMGYGVDRWLQTDHGFQRKQYYLLHLRLERHPLEIWLCTSPTMPAAVPSP